MSGGAEDSVQGELEEERAAGGILRHLPSTGRGCPEGPAAHGTSSHAPHGAGRELGTAGVWAVGGILPTERRLPASPWHPRVPRTALPPPRGPPDPAEPRLKRNQKILWQLRCADGRVPGPTGECPGPTGELACASCSACVQEPRRNFTATSVIIIKTATHPPGRNASSCVRTTPPYTHTPPLHRRPFLKKPTNQPSESGSNSQAVTCPPPPPSHQQSHPARSRGPSPSPEHGHPPLRPPPLIFFN